MIALALVIAYVAIGLSTAAMVAWLDASQKPMSTTVVLVLTGAWPGVICGAALIGAAFAVCYVGEIASRAITPALSIAAHLGGHALTWPVRAIQTLSQAPSPLGKQRQALPDDLCWCGERHGAGQVVCNRLDTQTTRVKLPHDEPY